MKHLFALGALVCLVSPSAFAFKTVQFDYDLSMFLCPMDKPDGGCSEEDLGPALFRDTVVIKVGDDGTADFDKTFTLRRIWGASVDVDLDVSFSKDIIDAKNFNINIELNPVRASDAGGLASDTYETSVTFTDPAAVKSIFAPGKTVVMKMKYGPDLSMKPIVTISKIRIQ